MRLTPRLRPLLAAAALAAAALTGCSGDDPAPAASPATPTPDQADADATPAATPPTAAGGDQRAATPGTGDGAAVPLNATCRLRPEGPAGAAAVAVTYPRGWDRGAGQGVACRFFHPEPIEVPEDSEAYGVAVRWNIDPIAFAEAAAPGEAFEASQRLPTVVDERRAVRLTGAATGEAGRPEGANLVVWLVDVSGFGADAAPATLVASADADRARAVDVLDRMVRAADIAPDDDAARGGTTVARYAGGATPFAVHHDRASGCLELFAGARQGSKVAEACDVGEPDPDPGAPRPLAAARLTEAPHDVAVGVTTGRVDVVRLRTNADTTRAVATVPLGDGRRGFALPLSGTEPALVAETFDGRVLGRVALGSGG